MVDITLGECFYANINVISRLRFSELTTWTLCRFKDNLGFCRVHTIYHGAGLPKEEAIILKISLWWNIRCNRKWIEFL